MHTIVEDDIRRLRGDGNGLFDPIPGWQNPAVERGITQSTQPQGNVTVIPIENDMDTVTTSNVTNLIKCCNRPVKEGSCCIGLIFFAALFIILIVLIHNTKVVGLGEYKRKQVKVSVSTNDSSSSNVLWDDYDSHYDITPQKVC